MYVYIYNIYGRVYFVCLANSVCGSTTGTFSWSSAYVDYMITKYDKILAKHENNINKLCPKRKSRVEAFQERDLLKMKHINAKKYTGFGVGV